MQLWQLQRKLSEVFHNLKWWFRTEWARLFKRDKERYILSFPKRLAPYDRRFGECYFDCMWYKDFSNYYHTFSLEEAAELKQKLELEGNNGAEFWDLKIYSVQLIPESKMLYEQSKTS